MPAAALPEISPVHFLVLKQLLAGERSGREIREALDKVRKPTTKVSFYIFMARLEDLGLVSGRYQRKIVANVSCRERRYKITAAGRAGAKNAARFYSLP